jgi:hypothetical protein
MRPAFPQRHVRLSFASANIQSLLLYRFFLLAFKYSTNLFRKATKCSAFRMFPGMASLSRSSGSTAQVQHVAQPGGRLSYQD